MLNAEEMREIGNRVLERLETSYIWEKMSVRKDGRRAIVYIQELKERRYEKAVSFLYNHYLTSEHLCNTVDLMSCPTSSSYFMHLILAWIRDGISLEAVVETEHENGDDMRLETESGVSTTKTGRPEQNEQEMIGLLVCRVTHKLEHSRTFSHFRIPGIGIEEQPYKGRCRKRSSSTQSDMTKAVTISDDEATSQETKLDKILKFRSDLALLVDIYEFHNVDQFLQIYIICIHHDWQQNNIAEALVMAAFQQAIQLNLSIAMGMFTSYREQQMLNKLGMKELAHISYKEWNNGSFFNDCHPENSSALIMTMIIKENPANADADNEN